jgi:hypothetical protein
MIAPVGRMARTRRPRRGTAGRCSSRALGPLLCWLLNWSGVRRRSSQAGSGRSMSGTERRRRISASSSSPARRAFAAVALGCWRSPLPGCRRSRPGRRAAESSDSAPGTGVSVMDGPRPGACHPSHKAGRVVFGQSPRRVCCSITWVPRCSRAEQRRRQTATCATGHHTDRRPGSSRTSRSALSLAVCGV